MISLVADVIDVVRDQLFGADYVREEDPRLFVSPKTGRGPLDEDWIQGFLDHRLQGTPPPPPGDGTIMCAYKLCRVEFRYWGMQSKIEKFIHDVGESLVASFDFPAQPVQKSVGLTHTSVSSTLFCTAAGGASK